MFRLKPFCAIQISSVKGFSHTHTRSSTSHYIISHMDLGWVTKLHIAEIVEECLNESRMTVWECHAMTHYNTWILLQVMCKSCTGSKENNNEKGIWPDFLFEIVCLKIYTLALLLHSSHTSQIQIYWLVICCIQWSNIFEYWPLFMATLFNWSIQETGFIYSWAWSLHDFYKKDNKIISTQIKYFNITFIYL